PHRGYAHSPSPSIPIIARRPRRPLFPYPPLFRPHAGAAPAALGGHEPARLRPAGGARRPSRRGALAVDRARGARPARPRVAADRSEEHTSELQSLRHLVCRLLPEKKNTANRRLAL